MDIKGISGITGKSVVFGLARSGVGAANLLSKIGFDVTVTDMKTEAELKKYIERLSPGIKLSLGGHPEGLLEGAVLIVVSPGVPLGIEPLRKAKARGIRIIGELELAYLMLRPMPFYAITGTNGKSTTTALLDLMMRNAGRRSLLGGNIGNALTEEILKHDFAVPDCVVAEVSSFQLEGIVEFRPKGAAILNVTPDHLDRYPSFEEYRRAKARIFLNQSAEDFLVLNADDPACGFDMRGARVFYFSRQREVGGVYLKDGVVYNGIYNGAGVGGAGRLIKAEEIRIMGVHNIENAMAASALALLSGCPADAVAAALREFPGLEHRLEFVRELNGVKYINDSKGTNVGAVVKSLESFSGGVILIAGGRDKKGDFSLLRPFMRNVKAVVAIGEAREKLKKALEGLSEFHFAESLRDSVHTAKGLARPGDVVLLSPACASFDMFRDFEDRGKQFKALVNEL